MRRKRSGICLDSLPAPRETPAAGLDFRQTRQNGRSGVFGNLRAPFSSPRPAILLFREEFVGARKEVRVGVSRTIGLAYLPGFFHANLRKLPQVGYRVTYQSSTEILTALEAGELDIGVVCPPKRTPCTLSVTHRFDDAFTLIAPKPLALEFQAAARSPKARRNWLEKQNWLVIEEASNTGQRLHAWMRQKVVSVEPAMQLDSFDLIINLVALGMGVSFVPIRALALYGRKRAVQRVRLEERFVRPLVVLRRSGEMPEHLAQFVGNVLF